MIQPDKFKRRRIVTGIVLLLLIPLGLLTKEYHGPGEHFISDKVAGILYVVFWSLLLYLLLYRTNIKIVVISVFIATCMLEFLQLVSCSLLDTIRSCYLGRAVIGNSFNWSDFIFYILGSIISYLVLSKINPQTD